MRVDPVLLLAASALAGALYVVAPLAVPLTALLVALLLRRRLSLAVRAVAVAVGVLGALRASLAIAAFEDERILFRDFLDPPRRCAAVAHVVSSPALRGGSLGFVADLVELDCEGKLAGGMVRARLYGAPPGLARGDVARVVVQIAPIRLFRNAALPDPTPRAARARVVVSGAVLSLEVERPGRSFWAWVDRARRHTRERIEATFSPAAAPMARALVLGENDLDPADDVAFRASGLAHLLAVSGTHLVFAIVLLVRAGTFVLVRIESLAARGDVGRLSAAAGAVLAPLYADFAGGSGSAWRAAWMLTAALVVRALGRRPKVTRVFAASLAVGWAADPLAAFDLSFLLSAAATGGLIAFGAPLEKRLARGSRAARFFMTGAIATVSAMIPCAPLLAVLAPTLTLAGIFANVVAMPFGEVVSLPLCLVHPLTTPVPWLERGVALVASGALIVVKNIAHASADATFLAVRVPAPNAWHFAVLIFGGLGALLARGGPASVPRLSRRPLVAVTALRRPWRRLRGRVWAVTLLAALALVEAAAVAVGNPRGLLRVTAVDVGQGDSTWVDLPDGTLMVVDGGGFVGTPVDPGRSVLLPMLRARRRDRIDIAVLSHPHPDHFTGLATALAAVPVGELWDTGQGEAEHAGPIYAAMIQDLRARGVPIRRMDALCGAAHDHGGARIQVLGPCPTFVPRRHANDNSLVLRVRYGERAVLLTGDAEREQERELSTRHRENLRADLLKVGHHGSRTSSSLELLAAVQPRLATISCGVRNPYGHPHAEALDRLQASRASVFRLDRTGSVAWTTNGTSERIHVFGLSR